MRIVIAGASGFVGRMLVPMLQAQGAELVLLGRDAGRLAAIFPDHVTASYEALPNCAAGADLFLNLAVVNNDHSSGLETMLQVNGTLAATLAASATRAGVGRFVNVNSIHALDPNDTRPYAVSKRAGQAAVDKACDGVAMHLFLPAIFGTRFAGALAPLNVLPRPIALSLLGPLSALRPILPVADLANWIMHDAQTAPRQVILTKGQMGNLSYSAASRGLDLAAAVVGLVALSPVLIATWGLIRSQGDGPAIFAQDRIGRHGRVFTCDKSGRCPWARYRPARM